MRKSIFFALAACLMLLLSSCEGAPGMNGMNGRDGRDGRDGLDGATVQTFILNVSEDDWALSEYDDNNFYVAELDMPEITKDVYIYSLIKLYRFCFDDGYYPYDISLIDDRYLSDHSSLMEMPYTRLNELVANGEKYFYTETVDSEIRVGKIYIYYTASDFYYGENPGPMLFKCSILDNPVRP